MPGTVLDTGELVMSVNGKVRQKSDLSKLIWSIPELSPTCPGSTICSLAT